MEDVIDFDNIKKKNPYLILNKEKNQITGEIHIECLCRDEFIKNKYEIKIVNLTGHVPSVYETGGKIVKEYHHLYSDGRLCLATDLEQELFLKDHQMSEWFEEYVKKFFVSYDFYMKYQVFPFGELSHGNEGVYEFVAELFNVNDVATAKRFSEIICTHNYRGHLECPCGSGKKIRKCHGEEILKIINSKDIEIWKRNFNGR